MIEKLIPIVMILAAAGIGYAYIYQTYTGPITDAQQQIASYDSALAAANTFSQKEADLTTQRNAISASDLQRLSTYMPDGVDNIQLIVDLDALAARSGVTLSGFAIQNNSTPSDAAAAPADASSTNPSASSSPSPSSTSATDSLDLSVTATGTYDAFQSFLTTAEQSSRPLDITNLSLKYSSTGVYTYAITFRIYWLQ
jgi:hypothetical protein